VDRLTQDMLETSQDQDLALTSGVPEVAERTDTPILAVAKLLWRDRIRVGKATLIGMAAVLILTLLIPNSYDGVVQLMPPDASAASGSMGTLGMLAGMASGSSSLGGAASGLAGNITSALTGQDMGTLFVGILESRTIADRLIDRFDLRKVYWRKTYEDARKKLDDESDIEVDRKTGIIKIQVSDRDPARAAAIAQAYVEELNKLLAKVNTSAASREREFLEQRLVLVHQHLQDASKDLSEYSSKNITMDPEKQGEAMIQAAAVLQGELIAAQSELRGLEQIYTNDNVRVRTLKANVTELQKQLNDIGGKNYKGSTSLDPDALYPSLRQLPVLGLQYEELYRRVKIDETVFELLTQAYELAKVEEAKETPSVKVLDAAVVPEKKSWPPRTLLTLVGGILGFVIGGTRIVASQLWRELDAEDPHKKFVQESWAEAKPFLEEKRARFLSRMHRRSRNGNSNTPEQDPS